MEEQRCSVVVVHEETEVGDLLTGLFHAHGFEVEWCRSHDAVVARLTSRPADLVVTAWDRRLGQEAYRWALDQPRDLRRRFVFIVDELPPSLRRAVAERRVARLADVAAVLDMVVTTCRRLRATTVPVALGATRPRLLLVEDDADQLAAMRDVLGERGYEIVAAGGVHAAVATLQATGVEAVLSDWCMGDGTGADLRAWIARHRPDLLGALVFVTGGDVNGPRAGVWPVPVLPKGQDTQALVTALTRAVKVSRRPRPT